jgi:hypothetical protein
MASTVALRGQDPVKGSASCVCRYRTSASLRAFTTSTCQRRLHVRQQSDFVSRASSGVTAHRHSRHCGCPVGAACALRKGACGSSGTLRGRPRSMALRYSGEISTQAGVTVFKRSLREQRDTTRAAEIDGTEVLWRDQHTGAGFGGIRGTKSEQLPSPGASGRVYRYRVQPCRRGALVPRGAVAVCALFKS